MYAFSLRLVELGERIRNKRIKLSYFSIGLVMQTNPVAPQAYITAQLYTSTRQPTACSIIQVSSKFRRSGGAITPNEAI